MKKPPRTRFPKPPRSRLVRSGRSIPPETNVKAPLLASLLMTGAVSAQPLLVRVTAADIRRLQQHDPMATLPPAPEAPTEKPIPAPVANSIILHDGTNWTIVPNGALICLPRQHQTKTNAKPVGHLMSWEDFLATNSSWLESGEVSFEQAAGNEKIPEESIREFRKRGKIIVATHRGGPISIDLGK